METIHEEEDEGDMETNSKNYSTADYSTEIIQKYIKEQKKQQSKSKRVTMKKQKPPRWICTVKNCTWGGRDMEMMMEHLKKHHPNEDGSQFKVEHISINKFKYGKPRKGSLKSIKCEVKTKKEVEQLEQKIKDL